MSAKHPTDPSDALAALESLIEGNRRFAAGMPATDTRMLQKERAGLVHGQSPFAAILGCSDSRVPVELVFDQGLGDLFVVRVAGNIATPSQIGSLEFAAEKIGTRLVVVLGHSGCGAVQETLLQLQQPQGKPGKNLSSLVETIQPAIAALASENPENLLQMAVRANVRATVAQIKQESDSLDRLARTDGLLIVGAEYSLETGQVDFFEGLSRS
jgi:carbonic anhydrase